MALSPVAAGLKVQQWDSDYFSEYVRASRFKRYMGTGESSMIQVKDDLTKKKGDSSTFALVNQLSGAGVRGHASLEGNEEKMTSRSHKLVIDVVRNAVAIDDFDEQMSAIDLRNAAKPVLQEWSKRVLRDDIVTALGQINGVAYGSATTAQKNTWNSNNSDRVLYGAAVGNYNATHSTALANIDNTADKLNTSFISLLKRIAQTASPIVRPIMVNNNDEEWYVLFAGSRAFRDLNADTAMQQANRDARARNTDNPLFAGGSLLWDGVIIREIPEIATLTGVGAGGISVQPVYLCGAQAVGIVWAQRPKSTTDVRDYEFIRGVGMQEMRAIEKLRFGTDGSVDTTTPNDNGVATGFVAAVADA